MKNKNAFTTPENNKKTKREADASKKQTLNHNDVNNNNTSKKHENPLLLAVIEEMKLEKINGIENKNKEEEDDEGLSNSDIQKNFFSKYLELKIPLPRDGSPISYLNCETLLSHLHDLYSIKTYKLFWLFDNNELTTTTSIFYQLLSPYWSMIQDTPALNTQMNKLLIDLINLQTSTPSKNKVLLELVSTLPLKQGWIQLLLDYYHNHVHLSPKSWLLGFLDSFISERKNAYLKCVNMLDKKTQNNCLIDLSDIEVNQVRELLNAFNNPCFTLTPTNGQYQLALVNQENYEKLKQELRFSIFIKASFSTHQEILKKIFAEIVQNHPQKDGGINIRFDKQTVVYLNAIYQPYFHLNTKTFGTSIEVIDSTSCLEIAKILQPDISTKDSQVPSQKSNSIQPITLVSNDHQLECPPSTKQAIKEPVTIDQSIIKKSKSPAFLRLMETILKTLPETNIERKGTLSKTYVGDFNKLYNNILRAYCSPRTGVYWIIVINSDLCLKLAAQLGVTAALTSPPVVGNNKDVYLQENTSNHLQKGNGKFPFFSSDKKCQQTAPTNPISIAKNNS